ncbi:hypothetical protein PhiSM_gp74 [Cellulophaga phage phiSM]|nr:hypothetical protein PhiSM_gp74 [Cellulophaga phage phiSM]AGO49393.1 hypothetical protein Phi3:1_gp74 [Cellulophaga phage phi3:1]
MSKRKIKVRINIYQYNKQQGAYFNIISSLTGRSLKIYKDRIDCLPEKHKSLISYLLEQKEIKKCEYFKEISIAEANALVTVDRLQKFTIEHYRVLCKNLSSHNL